MRGYCQSPRSPNPACRRLRDDYDLIVLARYGKVVVVCALVLSTGLQWAALQTVAWTSMLAANLRSHSMSEAMSDTFGGRHPCPICRAIAAARKAQKNSEALAANLKFEFPPVADGFTLISPAPDSAFSQTELSAASVPTKPPVPPPRTGCA